MLTDPSVEMTDSFTVIDGPAATTLEFIDHTGFERQGEFVLKWEKARKSDHGLKYNLTIQLRKLLFTQFRDLVTNMNARHTCIW